MYIIFFRKVGAILVSFFFLISFLTTNLSASQFSSNASSKINQDLFLKTIYDLAKSENIKTILEIGSSKGESSTDAFVMGIRQNPSHPILYCLQVSKERFACLTKKYFHDNFVKCYNLSSVPLSSFATKADVTLFYNTVSSPFSEHPLNHILGVLQQDINKVKLLTGPENGIKFIKLQNAINNFDLVLINGSQFTGSAELKLVYGAKFLLLNDISTIKNFHNFHHLMNDSNYSLSSVNYFYKNGYALFKKN